MSSSITVAKKGGQVAPDSYRTEEYDGSYVYKRSKLGDEGKSKKNRGKT